MLSFSKVICPKCHVFITKISKEVIITRPRMGPSLGFVTDVFLCVCRAMEHIMVCSNAPFELYYTIGYYFSRYDLSFK